MARRRKTTAFEDLIFIASRLPWWASLLIALGAWLLLHPYAISKPPTAVNPQQLADALTGQVWRSFALIFQYLIPAAFVLGAIGSIVGRAKRKKLAAANREVQLPEHLDHVLAALVTLRHVLEANQLAHQ